MGSGGYVDREQLNGDDEQGSIEGSLEDHNRSSEWPEETPTGDEVVKSEEIEDWGKI